MDGSFSLGAAVERFLARCPELRDVEKLDGLSKKGKMVTAKEVVSSMAELFPNPKYTIPLMGSFRSIARDIVDEAVSLLRCCNLRSDIIVENPSQELESLVDPGVVYVMEHYERMGRGLHLHELACLAFCRALDLNSSLLGSISAYFEFAPPPFEHFLTGARVSKFRVTTHCLLAARVSYRLLVLGTEFLSSRWDWSCFLNLLNDTTDVEGVVTHGKDIADIRWCGVQILCILMKLSDRVVEKFGLEAGEAAASFLRWEEFCQDVAIEKISSFVEPSNQTVLDFMEWEGDSDRHGCVKLGCSSPRRSEDPEVEPISKARKLGFRVGKSPGGTFVMTTNIMKSFEMILLSVNQRWPVLLYGPAGSGKSALINKLASDAGCQVLSLQMDDQIDGKTLIGSYVCAEQPGEFRWQPGSLTQAVMNGYWVVLEDIDKASPDLQSILLPLLEGATTFVTGHGEEIEVAENFRLFSTISVSKHDAPGNQAGKLLSNLWRRVMIGLPSSDDVRSILKAWYPDLEPLFGNLLETMSKVNYAWQHNFVASQLGNSPPFSLHNRFSLRDLLKWCKRIAGQGYSSNGDLLMDYQWCSIFKEAVDVFAASPASAGNRMILAKEIANWWRLPVSEAENLCAYKPGLEFSGAELKIGRVVLQQMETATGAQRKKHETHGLVEMRSSLQLLEKIACSVKYNEPVLLVGETGTGKTTIVQNLASMIGQRLTVLNLSQQSDIADLLGGFKPMDPQSICIPLYKEFENLFSNTWSVKENYKVFVHLQKNLKAKNWRLLLNGFKECIGKSIEIFNAKRSGSGKKRKKPVEETIKAWENFSVKVETANGQIGSTSGMVFSFVEGAFVTALRKGEWILLDEVNLAPPETLQRLVGVLEGEYGSLCLAERGDICHILRHPRFRIFACMNPATDAGKRDLPHSLRDRFTQYFVDDVWYKDDLKLFINKFMDETRSNSNLEKRIIEFYEAIKKCSEERLQDGANQKPQYSLRSLYRAMEYTRKAKTRFGFQKALYDGFCMFFLTLLDRPSALIVKKMIIEKVLVGSEPSPVPFDAYLSVKKDRGSDELESYILTESVKKQLENLARCVFVKKYPVLLQGPTSSGKTSLVQYLAAKTDHEFVRINNHEHTDLQEYLGSYVSDASGKLVFQEGALVKAARNGHWIVLDELNLAPSDVLEALNRLLDDNRELFVPELGEVIRPHPSFMLFATQNPPTFYGGRKMLSRAFRNRFVELHVEEIPEDELVTIIQNRCKIPGSRAGLMVKIMKDLQLHRQKSKVFAGKHGFITPRDLFRWANRLRRFGDSKEVMAEHGYYLLADRLRDEGEKHVVQEVLERHLGVRIDESNLYKLTREEIEKDLQCFGDVILTRSMRRLFFLLKRSYELREPVLLVGETGGGKTTVCQLLGNTLGSKLHILNCHQYTETSDFLGGFHPVRERSRLSSEFKYLVEKFLLSKAYAYFPQNMEISSDIDQASSTLDFLASLIRGYKTGQLRSHDVIPQEIADLEKIKSELEERHQMWQTIFMWQDGPLVEAMKSGDLFLVDEISLADDSVLERLNSVLEPERKLSLAEKGGPTMERITAHENFFVLATMNPGGDFGKKELSPALRNRFTEIWVPPVGDVAELGDIASKRFSDPNLSDVVYGIISFWEWFNDLQTGRTLTVRDLLSWVGFVNETKEILEPVQAVLHGLFLVLLDGLSLGTGMPSKDAELLREKCFTFLSKKLKLDVMRAESLSKMENYGWANVGAIREDSCSENMQVDGVFGIHPFYIKKGNDKCNAEGFEFLAPTTRKNAFRVLRAMQLPKPVLLEGSPGVGKTSLIMALGKYSGHKVVRINLSEQTDLMDLLGSDLPIESEKGMQFAWSDGILLQALKDGCWVLLDELNLAPQSVLEGLNAILDHRAEVFIPELGLSFKCPSSFRVFACQNPISQGGGRKGLPKSFLNRFTKVYVDELIEDDYIFICSSLHPEIPRSTLSNLVSFNRRMYEDIMLHHKFGQSGLPWEFNLRDVIRSCQIIQGAPESMKAYAFLNIIYLQRMRTVNDRKAVVRLYEEVFGVKPLITPYPRVQLDPQNLVVGNTIVRRSYHQCLRRQNSQLNIMPGIRHSLEAVSQCVQHQWLCILVGPASSGKTSLIRLLAQLTGNVLHELNLSSATEISELLGCFEQYNAFRNFKSVVVQIDRYVSDYCSLQLEHCSVVLPSEFKDIVSRWLSFSSHMDFGSASSSYSAQLANWDAIPSSLGLLSNIIEHLEFVLRSSSIPVAWSINELNKTKKAIAKLLEDQERKLFSAKFEWVAGSLIKAIENGEWVVLESANLCNPTVLDRINSLVEPSGSITVNECGIVEGSHVILHPHSNFRMFLTVNPRYGEVSRAMRNRGVEIFMMQPYWLFDEGSDSSRTELELRDVKSFLVLSGVPVANFVDSMARAHMFAMKESLCTNVEITYLELARWVQLFLQLLREGNRPVWSLQVSWEHTYLSSLGEAVGSNIVNQAKISYLSVTKDSDLVEYVSYLPGGWPKPGKLTDFLWYSKETSIKQNFMYLEYLAAQYILRFSFCGDGMDIVLPGKGYFQDYMDYAMRMLKLEFPQASNWRIVTSKRNTGVEAALARRTVLIAARWTIEQANENDYNLYRLRFAWLGSQMESIDHCLGSFLLILGQELDPNWKQTLNFHQSSVDLVRLSYQQWNVQRKHSYTREDQKFEEVFRSLEELERELLSVLVGSQSHLVQLYSVLLGNHMVFWDALASSQHDKQLISWHALMKDLVKLQTFCPRAVSYVSEVGQKNLSRAFFNYSSKSLLWIHGGHPFLPSSAGLYHKQQEFLKLCESIWPAETNSRSRDELVASFNPELRSLAVQGICMSEHMTRHADQSEDQVLEQLDEMYKMLGERSEHEKWKLKSKIHFNGDASGSCCFFSPGVLLTNSGFGSWQETAPLNDSRSVFLDMELLDKLSFAVLVDPSGQQSVVGSLFNLLESALEYSLAFSTRLPQNFVPHQKIMWTLDVWKSVDSANAKITSYALELWFQWHSSLWSSFCSSSKNFPPSEGSDIPLPHMLVRPVATASIIQMFQGSRAIKDHQLRHLKFRVASSNLWWRFPFGNDVDNFLLSASRGLAQMIIYAHRKAYDSDKFTAIRASFDAFQRNTVTEDDFGKLISLIATAKHQRMKSCLHMIIKPLFRDLYLNFASTDFHLVIGRVWLRIAGLRCKLLLSSDDLDPAVKYQCKYAILEEKISSIELEMKVRLECNYFSGELSSEEADRKRVEALEKLKIERKKLQKKMVFRLPSKEDKLLQIDSERQKGLELVTKAVHLACNIETMGLDQYLGQVCNWQEIAQDVINRLSDNFKDYNDIIQPLQVALYEMKLGLSLVVTGALQKSFLSKIKEKNVCTILDSIYRFMKFPRAHTSRLISSGMIDIPKDFWESDLVLLEKLVTSNPIDQKEVSKSKAFLLHNFLMRVAHFMADTSRVDKASLHMLNKIFGEVAVMWMNIKAESQGSNDIQQYTFKPRAFEIKSILDTDVSELGRFFTDDTFSEWKEMFLEEDNPEKTDNGKEQQFLQDERILLQDPISNDVIDMHNKIFGSDLVSYPAAFCVSDAERLLSFTESYTVGAGIITGPISLCSSNLDSKLVAEHQLRLCLEHEQMFVQSAGSSPKYNFYKDANGSAIAKMVNLLAALQQRTVSLLNEWEDHPGLQKIKEVTEMLLAIPAGTPLTKVLSGLQFLMNKVKILQEEGKKFSLSDQSEPLIALVCSWKKMEFDSWPALLDEVQDQYDNSAAKLWFPLYSILHQQAPNVVDYGQSITESLQEFIHTSSVGEFRKRLQLLFAFHGHITTDQCLGMGSYSSPWGERNLEILYNVCGYYVQFLPRMLEYARARRKNIEVELKELMKLCRWERPETCLSIENSRTTRQKLRKLIQKYTEMLQQPVMVILTQEANLDGMEIQSLQGVRSPSHTLDENIGILTSILDKMQSDSENRFLSLNAWRQKVVDVLNSYANKMSKYNIPCYEGNQLEILATQSACVRNQEWQNNLCHSIEKICRTTIDYNELWNDLTKGVGKRRALSEMLKLLERSGLQKHKFENLEVSNNSTSLFVQPSYDARHLLPRQSRFSSGTPGVSLPDEVHCLADQVSEMEWKTINEFYFRSTASVQVLRQICLKPHQDITNEQVSRSVSFLNHLIIMQQMQRAAIYPFAIDLMSLRESFCSLEHLFTKDTRKDDGTSCCIAQNQDVTFKGFWKQKHLLDGLVAVMVEESALLRVVESAHLKSCPDVKKAAGDVLQLIEKFIPAIKRAKVSLDSHLHANIGASWPHSEKVVNRSHLGITPIPCDPFVISQEIVLEVNKNFQAITDFETHVLEFHDQNKIKGPVVESLLANLGDFFKQSKSLAEELNSASKGRNTSGDLLEGSMSCTDSNSRLQPEFDAAFKRTCELVMTVFRSQCSLDHDQLISEEELLHITMWEPLFKKSTENWNLKELHDNLLLTIFSAERLINHPGTEISSVSAHVGACLKHLHELLGSLLSFGDGLLEEFLAMHKTVAIMTDVLANVLASLFSKGFRIPSKDKEEDAGNDVSQDANGTGMGEGSGQVDVSEQITDEDQLLGSSQKQGEEDNPNEVPNKDDKGIEMADDFMGDTFSVSEDSGEESEEGDDDEQLDNAMGEAGASSDVVDEKLWNKEDDEKPDRKNEKYESGSSVRDKDTSNREMRAKDDTVSVEEEAAELNAEEIGLRNDEVGDQGDLGDTEDDAGDTSMDKEEAFAEPSDIKLDEVNQNSDVMDVDNDMDEGEDLEMKEENCQEGENEDGQEGKNENPGEEISDPVSETMEEDVMEQVDRDSGVMDQDGTSRENLKTKSETSAKNELRPEMTDFGNNSISDLQSATQPNGNFQELRSTGGVPEADVSYSVETSTGVTPLGNLPQSVTSGAEVTVADPSNKARYADNPENTDLPVNESSSSQKVRSNPYRNVGDALQEWKERVRVSEDLQAENQEALGEVDDRNASEYGYVPELEKGTAQALGPATSEQVVANIPCRDPEDDLTVPQEDDDANVEIDDSEIEERSAKQNAPIFRHKLEETQNLDSEKASQLELPQIRDFEDGYPSSMDESSITLKKSLVEDLQRLRELSVDDNELGKAQDIEQISNDVNGYAASVWQRYQLRTTRLSQELAEQLRLVMEPTLASKLQGDYKTGKRINMKKVIPYIASHYRKDKIWLRRTRPNKRDYQVVIAVDDSRSMSESHCGDVAVEALVTVCNAMSQLEMGNLAVTSFGKKGNIRLLHDFDQPFTGEAGIKIVSSLTFKQENTIVDEPVVDLLKYLNNMLDTAVAKARLPSGQNPLQQLVLIIADGRFHEKEKLKRCVRDFLSQKRMVAFLLLDSPEESIMDQMEASFGGDGVVKLSKYLDSFPFPYYIVLRNINALPRTLGDLLRQWLELMQSSQD